MSPDVLGPNTSVTSLFLSAAADYIARSETTLKPSVVRLQLGKAFTGVSSACMDTFFTISNGLVKGVKSEATIQAEATARAVPVMNLPDRVLTMDDIGSLQAHVPSLTKVMMSLMSDSVFNPVLIDQAIRGHITEVRLKMHCAFACNNLRWCFR